jgi:translation initiation factor IF-2
VTESDVLLASASNAVIIGFNVRPEPKRRSSPSTSTWTSGSTTIIYDAINQVRESLEGMLEPSVRERTVGRAEVRQVFGISGIGTIAGSVGERRQDRPRRTGAAAARSRGDPPGQDRKLEALQGRRPRGLFGLRVRHRFEGFNDLKPGDVIEVYEVEKVARRMTSTGSQRTGGAHVADRAASA